MEVVDDLSRCPRPPAGTVVTIGAYDGVHRGHRRLIALVRDLAAARGAASAVVTFDRHPALVVRPESAPGLLTDTATKLELLAGTGLDYAVVVPFDEARSREPAEDFVREVLVGCLAARLVVVGHDFHFGYRRGGNVELLARIGPGLGFEALGVELFAEGSDREAVSSTRVRTLLRTGDVAGATYLLGRPHRLRGVVDAPAPGSPPGRLGALAVPPEYLRPGPGLYAGWLVEEGGDVPLERPVVVAVDAAGDVLLDAVVDTGTPVPRGRTAHVAFVERIGGAPVEGADPAQLGPRARHALGLG